MSRLFAVLLCALVLPSSAHAQSWFTRQACEISQADVSPEAMDQILPKTFGQDQVAIENGVGRLWEITAPNGKTSHLWGTVHSTDRLMVDLPDKLRQILASAASVGVEISPVAADRQAVAEQYQGAGMYDDTSLSVLQLDIHPKVFEWIGRRMAALGSDPSSIEYMSAGGLVSLALSDPCDDFVLWTFPIQDYRIALIGRDAGARIVGLEDEDAVIRELNRPERRATANAIINAYGAFLGPDNVQTTRRTFFGLYLQGRIGDMMAWEEQWLQGFFGARTGTGYQREMDAYLVEERNFGFLERMLPLLDQGDAVIAVGSFHLPGKNGLVSMLRQVGFTVTRVPLPGEAP